MWCIRQPTVTHSHKLAEKITSKPVSDISSNDTSMTRHFVDATYGRMPRHMVECRWRQYQKWVLSTYLIKIKIKMPEGKCDPNSHRALCKVKLIKVNRSLCDHHTLNVLSAYSCILLNYFTQGKKKRYVMHSHDWDSHCVSIHVKAVAWLVSEISAGNGKTHTR